MTTPQAPDLDRMREAAEKATPGDLDSIPKPNSEYGGYDSGSYECPACGGYGEVKGETFTNFDGVALGVQFFGIGNEFKAYEEFFRAANPASVLYLLDRIAELEGERDAALREMTKYAREAGEAVGKLETSEAAGIVEGWKERVGKLEDENERLRLAILGGEDAPGRSAHTILARLRASLPHKTIKDAQ